MTNIKSNRVFKKNMIYSLRARGTEMKNTKITWCDATLNPVIGCKLNCPYCYAKVMNNRYGFIDNWNDLLFISDRLKQLNTVYPKSIFMNSMSDIAFWENEWIEKVFSLMKINSKNEYIFLTRDAAAIRKFGIYRNFELMLSNKIFLGLTITNQDEMYSLDECEPDFVAFEPLASEITALGFSNYNSIKVIIIGAETGNRIQKIVTNKMWVRQLVQSADKANIKVYMKDSLKSLMGAEFRQDNLPWTIHK